MRIHSVYRSSRLPNQSDRLDSLRSRNKWCLIVLDACRFDFLADLFDSYFQGRIEPVWSPASDTFEYQRKNWGKEYEYPYVTGAAPITPKRINFNEPERHGDGLGFDNDTLRKKYKGYQPSEHLSNIDAVWQDSWDPELGVCPPEPVTERAKTKTSDRLVVHYFQPHAPYIGEVTALGNKKNFEEQRGGAVSGDIWRRVREGEITDQDLRQLYQSNLERVLFAVAELIRFTASDKYIITGDHGEALGEYGRYAHSLDWHPYVRTVPWAEVFSVNDSVQSMNDFEIHSGNVNKDVGDRLKELGYIDK